MLKLTIEGPLKINHITAEILEHVCGYDLLAWFHENCSKQFTKEQLREALSDLGNQASHINECMAVAKMAVNTRNSKTTHMGSAYDSNRMVAAQKKGLAISKMDARERLLALDELLIEGDHMLYQLVLGKLAMISKEAEAHRAQINAVTSDAIENPAGPVCEYCDQVYTRHFGKPGEPGGVAYCDQEFTRQFKAKETQ